MAKTISIKGAMLQGALDAMNELLREGEIQSEDLEDHLEPGDLELLEKGVHIASWYPIEIHTRLLEAIRDLAGDGRNDYLRELGKRSARRLLDRGLYHQLEYLKRQRHVHADDPDVRFRNFGHDLKLLVTLSASAVNVEPLRVELDPEVERRYRIVGQSEGISDVFMFHSEGFMNGMHSIGGGTDIWRATREKDAVIYRMTRDI